MKRAVIMGLGPSVNLYQQQPISGDLWGVNDSARYCTPDNLVVVDKPERFTAERLDLIYESGAKKTYSNLNDYAMIPGFTKIELCPIRHKVDFTAGQIPHSNNSPFVAAALCVSLGYEEIVIYGVDLYGHHFFKKGSESVRAAVQAFGDLHRYSGGRLSVCWPGSALASVLPVFQKV